MHNSGMDAIVSVVIRGVLMLKKLALTLLCLTLVAFSVAQMRVVKLKSGSEIKGVVTTTPDGKSYEIRLKSGGQIKISKDQVLSIESVVSQSQDYQGRLAKIDPNSPDERFALAEWAAANGLLDEALEQLQEALKLNKDHIRSTLLLRQVERRIARRQDGGGVTQVGPTTGRGDTAYTPDAVELDWNWLIDKADISRIRLEELRTTDRVGVKFQNNVLNRFIDAQTAQGRRDFLQPGFAKKFRSKPNVAKVFYILKNIGINDTATKDDLVINRDPQFMVDFKKDVWPFVAQYCASTKCHGGSEPLGGLKLFKYKLRNERMDYTNYLILDTFELPGGRKMINRNDPENSLLLQYGLPLETARFKHPADMPVIFSSREAANFKRVLAWIGSLKRPLHPNYRIKWTPPFGMKLNLSGRTLLPMAPVDTEGTKGESQTTQEQTQSPFNR